MLALLAVLTSACQLSLATDVTVDADGGGELALTLAADEQLTTLLRDAGSEPFQGLDEAARLAPAWTVEADETDDGGLMLAFRTDFDRPEQLGTLLEDLQTGLSPADARILDTAALTVDEEGAASFEATAGFLPPTAAAIEGSGIDVDRPDLETLLEERGDELVRYDLRVRFPGRVTDSDADEVDGNVATWRLPVGRMRTLTAQAAPPGDRTLLYAIGAGIGTAFLVGAVTVLVRRRHG